MNSNPKNNILVSYPTKKTSNSGIFWCIYDDKYMYRNIPELLMFLSHIFRKILFFCEEEIAIAADRPNILMKVFEDYIF